MQAGRIVAGEAVQVLVGKLQGPRNGRRAGALGLTMADLMPGSRLSSASSERPTAKTIAATYDYRDVQVFCGSWTSRRLAPNQRPLDRRQKPLHRQHAGSR